VQRPTDGAEATYGYTPAALQRTLFLVQIDFELVLLPADLNTPCRTTLKNKKKINGVSNYHGAPVEMKATHNTRRRHRPRRRDTVVAAVVLPVEDLHGSNCVGVWANKKKSLVT
jgi:hypothetical protein